MHRYALHRVRDTKSVPPARRCPRLFERVRTRERIDLQGRADDPRHRRVGLQVDLEQLGADGMVTTQMSAIVIASPWQ